MELRQGCGWLRKTGEAREPLLHICASLIHYEATQGPSNTRLDGVNSLTRNFVAVCSVQHSKVLQGWRRTVVLRLEISTPTGRMEAKLHISLGESLVHTN